MDKNIFTPTQAAEILGMKTSSVYALICRHELAADKVGRSRYISIAQLEAYLKNRGNKDVIDYTYAK